MMLPLGAEVVIRYALPDSIVCLLAMVLDSASESCSTTIKNKRNEVCEMD